MGLRKIKLNDDEYLLVTKHAADRILKRQIHDHDIRATYNEPDGKWVYSDGKTTNFQKQFDGYKVKIGVRVRKKNHLLITSIKIVNLE